MSMKRIGVTGASGFVGKHFVSRLLQDGYAVHAYVRDASRINFLGDEKSALRIFEGDISDMERLEPFVKSCDVIIHLAAGTQGKWTDYFNATVRGSELLLALAEKYGTERLVVMSSIGIYDLFTKEDGDAITERHALEPYPELRGWYAHSKLLGEGVFTSRISSSRVPITVLRAGLIYAENMKSPLVGCGFMIKGMCVAPGIANKRMPYVHISDLYEAMVKSIGSTPHPGIYNIVGDEQPTVRAIVRAYNNFSRERVRFIPIPRFCFALCIAIGKLFSKRGHVGRIAYALSRMQRDVSYSADSAKKELEWQPRTQFGGAMQRIAEFSSGDVNIAILGCGFAMQTLHVPAIQRIPRLKVRALYDADRARATEAKNKFFPGAEVLSEIRDLDLADRPIDFVVIATPPDTHAPLAAEFVSRGIHALIEKPVAPRHDDAVKLEKLAETHHARICVVNNYRLRDNVLELRKRLAESGGDPLLSIAVRFWSGPSITSAKNWRAEFKNALTHEMAYHFLDIAAEFGGRVQEVSHLDTRREGEHDALEEVSARVRTEKGVTLDLDLRIHPPYAETSIEFSKKNFAYKLHFYPESLEYLSGTPTPVTRLTHQVRTIISYALAKIRKPPSSHERLYRLFIRAVKDPHERTPISIPDTLPTLEFVERITR